jgi:hypothetical protein
LASKSVATVSSGLATKLAATVFTGLASKPVTTVFTGLTSKPVAMVFSSLASKLVTTVSPGLTSKPVVGFLVEPQNQGGGRFSGLGLKTGCSNLVIWASKSPRRFLGLWLKTKCASVYRLHHKIDGGRSRVGHTSRSSGLFHVEANLARVYQFGLNTGGGVTAGGACGTITEVASEAS